MNRDEYVRLFHKLELNLVAFKRLLDCDEEVLKLVNAAIAAEREACARVCDGWDFVPGGHEFTPQQLVKNLTETIAHNIRARGAP